MMQSYLRFIKHAFDFDSKDSRQQFWLPFLIQMFICIVIFLPLIKAEEGENILGTLLFVMIVMPVVLIPIYSAIQRRMLDVGKESKLYKYFNIFYLVFGIVIMIYGLLYFFSDIKLFKDEIILPIIFLFFVLRFIFLLYYCALPTNKFKSTTDSI
ncbi:DUF805 domain-containing protein [Macrococcoides goetzii]|nr:DUF805 domain-containing protein [Macrococcus goetzii]